MAGELVSIWGWDIEHESNLVDDVFRESSGLGFDLARDSLR